MSIARLDESSKFLPYIHFRSLTEPSATSVLFYKIGDYFFVTVYLIMVRIIELENMYADI